MANEDHTRVLLELLYHVSREVATALDLRTVLQRVLYEAVQNVGGERGSIVVLDDNERPIDSTIIYGNQFLQHTTQQLRETVERGLAGWVVHNRKAALVPDTSKDERWLRRPDDDANQSGAKAAICVPLLAREKLVGVLTLVHPLPNAFGTEHLELMQAIADQAGIAVLNARLYTESQRQARVMTALVEGAVTINSSLHLTEVLDRILDQMLQAMQVEMVALALTEASTGDLIFRAAKGKDSEKIIGQRIPVGQGIAGWVAKENRGAVIGPVTQDTRYAAVERFSGVQVHAIAAAPIQVQGAVIGILEAINPISGSFDSDTLLVMTGIGSLAGTTIQNAQLFEQLQAAHTRYRELFEDSIDPIIITDPEGRIIEVNRQAEALSGYPSGQLRMLTMEQLHDVNLNKIGQEIDDLEANKTHSYESMLHRHEGGPLPVEIYVRKVSFEESSLLQWILRDISERKELDSLREDMTAMIYHDLRSPLANIVSSLDVLEGMLVSQDDESIKTLFTIASNSTSRIHRLISSLLDINRLESGQKIVSQQLVDPIALVQQAVKDVQPSANSRRQTIEVDLPDSLPSLWVDEDMSRRILINLLENAVKYAPAESPIKIGARAEDKMVRFWVQDSGPGIPADEREHIFDKFTRLKSKETSGGLGVGLAFCRLAVQGHGGRIWVESEPDQGARFQFTLPVASSDS
jgi:NtrC-family two-component system sensor histidine kinase KinB